MPFPPQREGDRTTQTMALDRGRSRAEARTLLTVARAGTHGAGETFPHSRKIAAGFGRYAPQGLRAMIGGAAAVAGEALRANAFVLGNRAGFVRPPGLRLAAHEAAHAVAQYHGQTPPQGVGTQGDAGERLADSVADRVAGGGSAEPLFAAALGAPVEAVAVGSPALQMDNTATWVAPPKPAPWTEIAKQLKIAESVIVAQMQTIDPVFTGMVETLGDEFPRAEKATAELDGKRPGAPRTNDPTQRAFGTLGYFMEAITATPQAVNRNYHKFEGGHLIADSLLGDQSYEPENFAPQRGQLNAPIWSGFEALVAKGVVRRGTSDDSEGAPKRELRVALTYLDAPLTVKTADVLDRLKIEPTALPEDTIPPDVVTLTQRVPVKWEGTADTMDDDFVWAHAVTVDRTKPGGASLGWLPKESQVTEKIGKATSYMDAIHWAMDSLEHGVDGNDALRTSGRMEHRRRLHTFTSLQSAPIGQRDPAKKEDVPIDPPKATLPIGLTKSPSWSSLVEAGKTGGDEDMERRDNLVAALNDAMPPGTEVSLQAGRLAFGALEYTMLKTANGETVDKAQTKKMIAGPASIKAEAFRIIDTIDHNYTNKSKKRPYDDLTDSSSSSTDTGGLTKMETDGDLDGEVVEEEKKAEKTGESPPKKLHLTLETGSK